MAESCPFVFLFILCGFLSIIQTECSVVELSDSFKELKKDGFWFVEFYAPWCGHCKSLEPIWKEVGRELTKNSNVVTAKLDCTKFRDLAEDMGIRGFPTIKFFRGEVSTTYRGSRSKEALVEFAKKASRYCIVRWRTENRQVPCHFYNVHVAKQMIATYQPGVY